MSKILSLLFLSLCFGVNSFSQTEQLTALKSNSLLYHQTKQFKSQLRFDYVQNNTIITTDADTLPFVDDFYSNTLKPYNFEELSIFDTINFATGSCILDGDFIIENVALHTTPSYYYTYNTLLNQVDSIMLSSINVYDYSESTCFPNETSITSYWTSYYRSTLADFDTSTGEKLDSTLVDADTIIPIATIFFANLPLNVHWVDNFAWWNTTNAISPISIGVASLDGLDEFGQPYNKTVTNAYGKADFLTSKPIDLSLLGPDDMVYLSFFYQAGGLADLPNLEDSLIVEFKSLDGKWTQKWATEGFSDSNFRQAYIPIHETTFDSLLYSNNSFQFRFRNYASLSGNNDIWNIDYVRLDKNRTPNSLDSVIRDVSVLFDFPNYLNTYSMLPWNQLRAGADDFTDTIKIPIRDNGQVEGIQTGNFPLEINISNSENSDIIYTESGANFNPQLGQEIKDHTVLPKNNFVVPNFDSDSVFFYSEFLMSPSNRNTKLENDTLRSSLLFHNVMAYDDGTAERAYGVEGGGTEVKKFAYEFEVATLDTLAAIQIHFSNVDVNVDNLVFSLFVWDSLEIGVSEIDNTVHQIAAIENKKPDYVNSKNGFATFVLDTAIEVTDKFYVGWAQTDNRNLQIGYDLNSTKGRDHMFVFADNTWEASSIVLDGSPMMRVILDGNYPIPEQPTPIVDVSKIDYIKIYPNPASTILNLDLPYSLSSYSISVYDYTGKNVAFSNDEKQIDVSSFSKGMYLLSIQDKLTNQKYTSRFLVK